MSSLVSRIHTGSRSVIPRAHAGNPLFKEQMGKLVKNAGEPLAHRLLEHLVFERGRLFVKHFQGGGTLDPNGRKYIYPGIKNSPIVVGSSEDIFFYPLSVKHPDQANAPARACMYLEQYVLFPAKPDKLVFLADTHNNALFGWALARELGIIDKNSLLVHVDAHYDDNPITVPHRTQYQKQMPRDRHGRIRYDETLDDFLILTKKYADITSFIQPGAERLFNEVYFVPTIQNGLGTVKRRGHYDRPEVEGKTVSIELIAKRVDVLIREGRKVILDLDLDYFAHYFQPEPDSGTEARGRIPFEDNLKQVIDLAQRADFVTAATSPDWFSDQQKALDIFHRITRALEERV